MNNRNEKPEQIICSAVNDFGEICHLELEANNGSYTAYSDGFGLFTLDTKYTKDNFIIVIDCIIGENLSDSAKKYIHEVSEDVDLKVFLENINNVLAVDENSNLLLSSFWEFPYENYSILKSSLVIILNESMRNRQHVMDLLESKEAEQKARNN